MSYGKAGIRKDSWNHRQDVILGETMANQIKAGIGVMEAAAIAAPLVGRGQSSCYNRWNTELKHKHWGDPIETEPKGGTDTMAIKPKTAGTACIDAIEAATAELTGYEAYSTGRVISLLFNWKSGGAEELREARLHLDRLIMRAEGERA